METQLKLICKVEKTHLPTSFPVYYFGTSHAKVYVVYSRSDGEKHILTAAILQEFSYNYEEGRLFERNKPVLIPEGVLNGTEKMRDIRTIDFNKDKLPEIVAKSFLNETLSTKQPTNKLKHPKAPGG